MPFPVIKSECAATNELASRLTPAALGPGKADQCWLLMACSHTQSMGTVRSPHALGLTLTSPFCPRSRTAGNLSTSRLCAQLLVDQAENRHSDTMSACLKTELCGVQLLVANVGDSRCFVGSINGQGEVESYALSTDHNPDVVSEAQRILAHKVCLASLIILILILTPCVERWPIGRQCSSQADQNICDASSYSEVLCIKNACGASFIA